MGISQTYWTTGLPLLTPCGNAFHRAPFQTGWSRVIKPDRVNGEYWPNQSHDKLPWGKVAVGSEWMVGNRVAEKKSQIFIFHSGDSINNLESENINKY